MNDLNKQAVLQLRHDFLRAFEDMQVLTHKIMVDNGWWEGRADITATNSKCEIVDLKPLIALSLIALQHSELSEAVEAVRKQPQHAWSDPMTKDTLVRELAGCIVRCMDMAQGFGLPLNEAIIEELVHNAGRGHRHGGKAA